MIGRQSQRCISYSKPTFMLQHRCDIVTLVFLPTALRRVYATVLLSVRAGGAAHVRWLEHVLHACSGRCGHRGLLEDDDLGSSTTKEAAVCTYASVPWAGMQWQRKRAVRFIPHPNPFALDRSTRMAYLTQLHGGRNDFLLIAGIKVRGKYASS